MLFCILVLVTELTLEYKISHETRIPAGSKAADVTEGVFFLSHMLLTDYSQTRW